jgi:hypothetical protein
MASSRPSRVDPHDRLPCSSLPKLHLFIRSIDESISHDVRLTSSMGGFSREYGYDCSER